MQSQTQKFYSHFFVAIIISINLLVRGAFALETRPVILINHYNTTYVNFTIFNPTDEYLLKNKIALEICKNDTWELAYRGLCTEFTLPPEKTKTITCKLPKLASGQYIVFLRRLTYLDLSPEGINYNFFYLTISGKPESVRVTSFKLLNSRLFPSQPVKAEMSINSGKEREIMLEWHLYKRSEASGMGVVQQGKKRIMLKKGENNYSFTFPAPPSPYLYELKTCLKTLKGEYLYCNHAFLAVKGRSGFVGVVRLFQEKQGYRLFVRTFPSMDMSTPVNLSLEITAKTKNKEYEFGKTYSTNFEGERNVFWDENFELREKPLEIKFVLRDKNTGEVYHQDVIKVEKAEAGTNVYMMVLIAVITAVLIGATVWQRER